jgi:prevent-host-death family protein
MRTVGSYEAKTHLPRLLDEVASSGEPVTITKNGKPVARLVPADDLEERRRIADEAWERWKRVRDAHHITLGPGMTVMDLIEESRRERDERIERFFDGMDERDRLKKLDD